MIVSCFDMKTIASKRDRVLPSCENCHNFYKITWNSHALLWKTSCKNAKTCSDMSEREKGHVKMKNFYRNIVTVLTSRRENHRMKTFFRESLTFFFTWSFVRLWKLPGKAATVYTWYPDSERCLCSLLWQICASVNFVLPLAVVPTDRRDLLGFPTFPPSSEMKRFALCQRMTLGTFVFFLLFLWEKSPPQPPAGSYVSSTSWTPPLWFLALLLWLIDLFDPFSSNNWMWRLRSLRRFCRKTLKKRESEKKEIEDEMSCVLVRGSRTRWLISLRKASAWDPAALLHSVNPPRST